MLTARSLPKLGSTLQLTVPFSWLQRNGAGADCFLATGLTNPNVRISVFGGYLFTSADVIFQTPQSPLGIPGTTTISLPIPNDSKLLGIAFFQQVLETSRSTGISRLSRGGHGVLGK